MASDLETRGWGTVKVPFNSKLLSLKMCECEPIPGQGWASVSAAPEISR